MSEIQNCIDLCIFCVMLELCSGRHPSDVHHKSMTIGIVKSSEHKCVDHYLNFIVNLSIKYISRIYVMETRWALH